MPHLVSLNTLALYPTELVALVLRLEPSTFYALDLILHMFLGAALMRWWLGRMGRSAGAAFTGGLLYALGGHLLTLAAAGHPHWVRCLAWAPLLFACLEGFPDGGFLAGALAGGVLSLALLGAAMHFVIIAIPVCVAWILCVGSARRGQRAARLAAFSLVPVVLGAAVWIPGLEYYLQSMRRSPEAGFAGQWSLSAWEIPALLIPGLWGAPAAYWGPHLFRSSTDYPGLLCVALAGVGWAAARRLEARWAVLAAAGFVLALGPATPVGAAVGALPVFSGLRVPLRWLSFTHIALCVLAARGWDEAAARGRGRIAAAALAGVAAACALLAFRAPALAQSAARLPFAAEHVREGRVAAPDIAEAFGAAARGGGIRAAASAAALAGLAVLPGPMALRAGAAWLTATADLLTAAAPFFQYADSRAAAGADPVAAAILPRMSVESGRVATDEYFAMANRRMPLGIEFTWGYHGLPLARYAKLYAAAASTGSVAILAALSVRYIVTSVEPGSGWTSEAVIESAGGERAWLLANPGGLPRAWLAPETVTCRDADEAIAVMRRPDWAPSVVPLEGRPALPLAAGRSRGRNEITFSRGVDELNASIVLARSGLVVLSEVWYPAWKAFVDGERVPILPACAALRAVSVLAGTHRLAMLYDSWTLKIGLWVSLAGWTVVAAAAAAFLRRRKLRANGPG